MQSRQLQVRRTALDKFVGFFSPKAELNRLKMRAAVSYLQEQGYVTSGSSKRSMRGWTPSEGSPDADINPKLSSIRASCRDLFMNTPVATGAIRRVKTNVVGFGVFLQCMVDRAYLKLSDSAADAWEMNTEREFNSWANSKLCDSRRLQTFYDLQSTAFLGMLLDGDVVVLLPRFNHSKDDVYNLKIRIVSGDHLTNPPSIPETTKTTAGIEINDMGAPIKYYLRKSILDSYVSSFVDYNDFSTLTPYTPSGMLNLIHLYDSERPNQRRGVALLAPITEELKNLSRLSKAELDASILNAFFTVFVKSSVPGGGLQPGFMPFGSNTLNPTAVTDESVDAGDSKIYEMGSGNIVDMDENEDITIADPKRPNANFAPFFDAIVQQIGTALEIPYEQLMLRFTASYSAARGAMLEAWKLYKRHRMFLSRNLCQPIYNEFLTEMVVKGVIAAPGYLSDARIRMAWQGATWGGMSQGQINPEVETRAALLKIEGNLSTHEEEFMSIHGNSKWKEAVSRKGREKKIIEENGLSMYQTKPDLSQVGPKENPTEE
jgi:lambda family phage portal protein